MIDRCERSGAEEVHGAAASQRVPIPIHFSPLCRREVGWGKSELFHFRELRVSKNVTFLFFSPIEQGTRDKAHTETHDRRQTHDGSHSLLSLPTPLGIVASKQVKCSSHVIKIAERR
jgi:hypothetical protein